MVKTFNELLDDDIDSIEEILDNDIYLKDNGNILSYKTGNLAKQVIEKIFEKYGIYVSIELGEDSSMDLWWTCSFKYLKKHISFHDKNLFIVCLKTAKYIEEEIQ